jgi:MFS family permease
VPGFRRFIASLLAQTLGSQMQAVVVGWQVYALTHDPLALGLVGLAEALPFLSTVLFAGHAADRADRRRMAIAATAVQLGCALALLGLTLGAGPDRTRVGAIYAVIFVSGLARSYLIPARTALANDIVPREVLLNAVTWRSSSWQLAAVIGPAIGGGLYALSGVAAAYGAVALLLLVSVLLLVRVPPVPRPPSHGSDPVWASLAEGVRFVRSQPIFLGAITLDLFAVLFGGAEALLPIFAADILRVGPEGLGILRAAHAAGAVMMSVHLSHRRPLERPGRALLIAVAIFGLCIIGFGLSTIFWLSVLLLLVGGMADNVSVVIRSSLLQTLTPPHLLGRVSAVNSIFIGSSNELGAFESGAAAKLLGTVPSVVIGGSITLLVVAVTALKFPALRSVGELK